MLKYIHAAVSARSVICLFSVYNLIFSIAIEHLPCPAVPASSGAWCIACPIPCAAFSRVVLEISLMHLPCAKMSCGSRAFISRYLRLVFCCTASPRSRVCVRITSQALDWAAPAEWPSNVDDSRCGGEGTQNPLGLSVLRCREFVLFFQLFCNEKYHGKLSNSSKCAICFCKESLSLMDFCPYWGNCSISKKKNKNSIATKFTLIFAGSLPLSSAESHLFIPKAQSVSEAPSPFLAGGCFFCISADKGTIVSAARSDAKQG